MTNSMEKIGKYLEDELTESMVQVEYYNMFSHENKLWRAYVGLETDAVQSSGHLVVNAHVEVFDWDWGDAQPLNDTYSFEPRLRFDADDGEDFVEISVDLPTFFFRAEDTMSVSNAINDYFWNEIKTTAHNETLTIKAYINVEKTIDFESDVKDAVENVVAALIIGMLECRDMYERKNEIYNTVAREYGRSVSTLLDPERRNTKAELEVLEETE